MLNEQGVSFGQMIFHFQKRTRIQLRNRYKKLERDKNQTNGKSSPSEIQLPPISDFSQENFEFFHEEDFHIFDEEFIPFE